MSHPRHLQIGAVRKAIFLKRIVINFRLLAIHIFIAGQKNMLRLLAPN